MLVNQLGLKHGCLAEDGMCDGGNTVTGDIYWSLVLTLFAAVAGWIVGFALFFIIRSVGNKKSNYSVLTSPRTLHQIA